MVCREFDWHEPHKKSIFRRLSGLKIQSLIDSYFFCFTFLFLLQYVCAPDSTDWLQSEVNMSNSITDADDAYPMFLQLRSSRQRVCMCLRGQTTNQLSENILWKFYQVFPFFFFFLFHSSDLQRIETMRFESFCRISFHFNFIPARSVSSFLIYQNSIPAKRHICSRSLPLLPSLLNIIFFLFYIWHTIRLLLSFLFLTFLLLLRKIDVGNGTFDSVGSGFKYVFFSSSSFTIVQLWRWRDR